MMTLLEKIESICEDIVYSDLSYCAAADCILALLPAWQSIDTAPKDGTRLWLYFPHKCPDDRQLVGWWENKYGYWMDHADSNLTDPTHWRPLPEPPQS